ncbi:MAG: rSAM-modified peptide [Bacteroidales bacterium]|nr:rSAM-modified peptide [Bacteroidales bacterium]
MKKEKKLKLDTLNLKELANKDVAQISGGAIQICNCSCYCIISMDSFFTRKDNLIHVDRTLP